MWGKTYHLHVQVNLKFPCLSRDSNIHIFPDAHKYPLEIPQHYVRPYIVLVFGALAVLIASKHAQKVLALMPPHLEQVFLPNMVHLVVGPGRHADYHIFP